MACAVAAVLHHAGAAGPRRVAALSRSSRRTHLRVQAVAATEKTTTLQDTPGGIQHQGPIVMNGQVLHSLTKERLEIVKSMTEYMEKNVMTLLKPVDKCWQPADFLPKSEDPDFLDKVRCLMGHDCVCVCMHAPSMHGPRTPLVHLPPLLILGSLAAMRSCSGCTSVCVRHLALVLSRHHLILIMYYVRHTSGRAA